MPPKARVRGTIRKKDDFKRLEDFKRCSICQSLIEAKLAKGLSGKKDDPIDFPHCGHALHASCLVEWYMGVLCPHERASVERAKRRNPRAIRNMALTEYVELYGGRCEVCARDSPGDAAAASSA